MYLLITVGLVIAVVFIDKYFRLRKDVAGGVIVIDSMKLPTGGTAVALKRRSEGLWWWEIQVDGMAFESVGFRSTQHDADLDRRLAEVFAQQREVVEAEELRLASEGKSLVGGEFQGGDRDEEWAGEGEADRADEDEDEWADEDEDEWESESDVDRDEVFAREALINAAVRRNDHSLPYPPPVEGSGFILFESGVMRQAYGVCLYLEYNTPSAAGSLIREFGEADPVLQSDHLHWERRDRQLRRRFLGLDP
jgi:hypothetical protein